MTIRVNVSPRVLRWARERSGIEQDEWNKRFPQYAAWLDGTKTPTLKQAQEFARKSYAPFGYLLLSDPPIEKIPIPDFRAVKNRPPIHGRADVAASADLLDTIYVCQARQEWFRNHQMSNGEASLAFVSSVSLATPIKNAAEVMRETLNWTNEIRRQIHKVEDALKFLRESAEEAGVLVMISGIVGSNTHRPLDPAEFRGFALSDPYAPLIFVNGADAKAAQLFTLCHELAHIWLGETALSDLDLRSSQHHQQERWCNQVAAELLVPMEEFRAAFNSKRGIQEQLKELTKKFKVSKQVILIRMREVEALTQAQLTRELETEYDNGEQRGAGGDFFKTKSIQVSRRFARELIARTLEGHTTYTEAFYLLDLSKSSTFKKLGQELGIS